MLLAIGGIGVLLVLIAVFNYALEWLLLVGVLLIIGSFTTALYQHENDPTYQAEPTKG